MANQEISVKSLDYTICINIIRGKIVVSQPDLGLFEGKTDFQSVKTLSEIGDLVGEMMVKVKREIAKRTVEGTPIPPPRLPKETLCIPVKEWMSLPEAAKYLGVSESTMRRLCESTIKCRQSKKGVHRKIYKEDLDDYKRTGGSDLDRQDAFPFMSDGSDLSDMFVGILNGSKPLVNAQNNKLY